MLMANNKEQMNQSSIVTEKPKEKRPSKKLQPWKTECLFGMNEKCAEMLASQLMEFVIDQPQVISIEEFYSAKLMPHQRWSEAVREYEVLGEAVEICQNIVGCRREKKCFEGYIPPNVFLRVQHHYHQRYAQSDIWHAKLREKTEEQEKVINLTIINPVPVIEAKPNQIEDKE